MRTSHITVVSNKMKTTASYLDSSNNPQISHWFPEPISRCSPQAWWQLVTVRLLQTYGWGSGAGCQAFI